MFRWLLNLPFQLLWNIAYVLVRLLIFMRRWVSPVLLVLIMLLVPLLGFALPRIDRAGSYIMVAAAIGIAFVAGKMSRRR